MNALQERVAVDKVKTFAAIRTKVPEDKVDVSGCAADGAVQKACADLDVCGKLVTRMRPIIYTTGP